MKTKFLMFGILIWVLVFSCKKDDDSVAPVMNSEDIRANAEMDNIGDDVSQIVMLESNQEAVTLRGEQAALAPCATITTTQSGNTWTRTIDFGATNCEIYNGNLLRGKMIITFTNNWAAATRTVDYTFDNFYHNNRHVEGTRNVVLTTLSNGHPNAVINLDLTVTTAEGAAYHRTGQRVREFTAGYNTWLNIFDDVYSVTGSWTTTMPSGVIHVATITSPVIGRLNCGNLVSGVISFTRNIDNATAVLDYGDGSCDSVATITINGAVYNILLY